jgi:D-3-phosphoglycerate dehydrogenase
MKYHVLVATPLTNDALAVLQTAKDIDLKVIAPNAATLPKALASADAFIIRDDFNVDAALLGEAKKLKVIGRLGVSLGGIDVETATQRGVIVMNTPGANAVAAAEYAVALLLMLSRPILAGHASIQAGRWERGNFQGAQLQGKTLGLIGIGRVGRRVAERALAFGMNVLAADPYVAEAQVSDLRVKLVSLDDILIRSDFISLHCAVTEETRNIIDARALSMVKPGLHLVNIAHGSMVDANALADAIRAGRVAGAALDAFDPEPPVGSPLIGLPGVIHTPHLGDATAEAQRDISTQIVTQVLDALRGEDYRNAVNMPFIAGRDFDEIAPYLRLAERIGALQHHLARGRVRRVAVEYKGDEISGLVKPLTVALLKGMLTPILGDAVNYINAPLVAVDRGIHVTQTKGLDVREYRNLVSCQVHWEGGGQMVISGTLFNQVEPRIVQMDTYRTDFVPEGTLIVFGSYDVPGVIGRVGTLLATQNINIAAWRTGRAEKGGQTLTVVTVDQPLSEAFLEEFRGQDFVRHATQLSLD